MRNEVMIPAGHGEWSGWRYRTDSIDRAIRRGEVQQVSREVDTATGRVRVLYRGSLRVAPAWRRPVAVAGVLLASAVLALGTLWVAAWAAWQAAVAVAPLLLPLVLVLVARRLLHGAGCSGLHCGGCGG